MVSGKTKGASRHKDIWWWNDEGAADVSQKQALFGKNIGE